MFLTYEDAKTIVHRLNLQNQSDWKQYCEGTNPQFGLKPASLPAAPDQFYERMDLMG